MTTIPCAIIRGGTSKGVFVREEHLPKDLARRDATLIALMGSPDPRQIDGLGGADPLTSKVVIVSRATRPGCDVEYESVEVALGETFVNHGIMCGNLTAAVTAFAAIEGLIPPHMSPAGVRMFCRNTSKIIVCRPPPSQVGGTGVMNEPGGSAATVSLVFEEPAGAVTGKLLPTGEPLSTVKLEDGRALEVSVVDAGTIYAFVRAEDVGVTGAEAATDLDIKVDFRKTIEACRVSTTQLINERLEAAGLSPRRLKMAIVARPHESRDADLLARVINPAKVHKAYAVSGAISLGSAASIRGTLVNQLVRITSAPATVRIGHPTGVLPVVVHYSDDPAGHRIQGAEIQRTFRVLMRGEAYLQANVA